MESTVIMYSAELCGDCQKLKAWLDSTGITYETRDIKKDPDHSAVLQSKIGKLGVPYLVINGEWKRGYVPGKEFSETFARELFGV